MDLKELTTLHDKLNRRMKCRFDAYFADTPLTSVQALTLEYVMMNWEERDVFQKDIEDFLSTRGSSVSSLIDNLERNDYLHRESVPYDGRCKKLIPTQKALDLQEDITGRIVHYTQTLFAGVPEQDLKVFHSVLLRMIQNAKV